MNQVIPMPSLTPREVLLVLLVGLPLILGVSSSSDEDKPVHGSPKPTPGGTHDESDGEDDGAERLPLPWDVPTTEEQGCSDEEIPLLRSLRARSETLDTRERALDEREAAIEVAEKELAATARELDTLRKEIILALTTEKKNMAQAQNEAVERLKARDAKKDAETVALKRAARGGIKSVSEDELKKLAKIVDTMRPKDAAKMLSGVDEDVAVQVLRRIKARQAGRVLGAMTASVAQSLGARMTINDGEEPADTPPAPDPVPPEAPPKEPETPETDKAAKAPEPDASGAETGPTDPAPAGATDTDQTAAKASGATPSKEDS